MTAVPNDGPELTGILPNTEAAPPAVPSPLRQFVAEMTSSCVTSAALVVVFLVVVAAAFAPLVAPTDPYDLAGLSIMDNLMPPGSVGMTGTTFWLGTDDQGRDLLSAMLYGLRVSLYVGGTSTAIALVFGTAVGLLAGYAGGIVDSFLMRVVDLQLSLPAILIALMLLALLGSGADKIIIALVAVQWAYFARTARAAALVETGRDYIAAARALGFGTWRVVAVHLLPNCLPPIIVVAMLQVANAIMLEATLSFLGLGLPPTEPSLGLLISYGFDYMMSGRYWISFFPGILLVIVIVALNLVGDRLRDALNPRLDH